MLESLLVLLQLFVCEEEDSCGFSDCFLSLGRDWRRKSPESSNPEGISFRAGGSYLNHEDFMQSLGKAEHFLRRARDKEGKAFLSPKQGLFLWLCFQDLGFLIHEVATWTRWNFVASGG